jgi:MYXO-CTERM domain-containing protein
VFESNSALATSGSFTVTGTDESSHTILLAQGENFLDFTATGGNVLLSSISYTIATTPELISLALTASGLLGLFLLRRRKKGSQNTDSRL